MKLSIIVLLDRSRIDGLLGPILFDDLKLLFYWLQSFVRRGRPHADRVTKPRLRSADELSSEGNANHSSRKMQKLQRQRPGCLVSILYWKTNDGSFPVEDAFKVIRSL